MWTVDLGRITFYLVVGLLTGFSVLPWWAPLLVILYDVSYRWTYKTKAYRAAETEAMAAFQRALDRASVVQNPVPPPDEPTWN